MSGYAGKDTINKIPQWFIDDAYPETAYEFDPDGDSWRCAGEYIDHLHKAIDFKNRYIKQLSGLDESKYEY